MASGCGHLLLSLLLLLPLAAFSGDTDCPTPSNPQNGNVQQLGSSLAIYSCNNGYTLRGSDFSFCSNGRWSSNSTCELFYVDGCIIKAGSPEAVGVPTYQGSAIRGSRIYSCSNSHNCTYSVHVLGVYEASSDHSGNYHPTVDSNVYIRTNGSGDTRPLVLVLSSYEPINWILHIPPSIVIHKVIVSSYHSSTVSYNESQVLEVENDLSFSGYGSDSGGGKTEELLQVISQRLSPVNSFTGTYRADRWILNINRDISTASQRCPKVGNSTSSGRNCPALSSPQNGSVLVSGSLATYSCNSHYTLDRRSRYRFCSEGRWSGSAPTCEALGGRNCPALSSPQNGNVLVSGSHATYSCNSRYSLRGSKYRFCTEGRWSSSAPTCEAVDNTGCPTPSNPQNGNVELFGSSAIYSCNDGYVLRGSKYVNCRNGRWSSNTTCELFYVDGCIIKAGSPEAVGVPTFQGRTSARSGYRIYSCSNSHNCTYSVHVIGVYEASSDHSGNYHPTGDSNVYIRTNGSGDTRPLVLVLSSHEPINWILHMPPDIVIHKVIVSSYYSSTVSYNESQVLEVEKDLSFYGYGSDSGGGKTEELLQVISQRLSPVNSFTGTYQADRWILNINRDISAASQRCPKVGNSTSSGRNCSALSRPRNGNILVSGGLATYSCNSRYYLKSGSKYRFCTEGRWSGSAPICEALVSVSGCNMEVGSTKTVGTPYYRGSSPRDRGGYETYSCRASHYNCNVSIHVIGVYEANGDSNVYLNASGCGDPRSLVLVLSSYESVNWTLHIQQNVVISKVILSSYYRSFVDYNTDQVLEVESDLRLYGYGSDRGGGQTAQLLKTITRRLGPVDSFTGTYQADKWILNINGSAPETRQGCSRNATLLEVIPGVSCSETKENETEDASSQNLGGVTYTRWGSTSCQNSVIYSGQAGGSYFKDQGGSSNYLCMPNDPEYELPYKPGIQGHSPVYGAKYKNTIVSGTRKHTAPCAVCYVPNKETSLMIPAKTSCPSGWTREYYGYLMSTHHRKNYRSQFICVDKDMAILGEDDDTHGAALYHTEATCNGLSCGPYDAEKELNCVVCTK